MGFFSDNTRGGLMRYITDPGKYVKDFRIEETKDEKGRVRRRAVYTGVWTVLRRPGPGTSAVLWSSLLLSFLIAGLYGWAVTVTHLTAGSYWVMVPLLLGLFPVLYLLMGALSLPFRGKPMRRDQYMHGFIRVSRSCFAVSVFSLAALLATLVFRAVRGGWDFFPEDWVFTVLCLLVPGLCAAVILLLRGVEVTEKENAAYKGVF